MYGFFLHYKKHIFTFLKKLYIYLLFYSSFFQKKTIFTEIRSQSIVFYNIYHTAGDKMLILVIFCQNLFYSTEQPQTFHLLYMLLPRRV